jgi:hypothetical protein
MEEAQRNAASIGHTSAPVRCLGPGQPCADLVNVGRSGLNCHREPGVQFIELNGSAFGLRLHPVSA